MGLFDRFTGFLTLGDDINKFDPGENATQDGVVSKLTPELTLNTPDEELIKLKKQWINKWNKHAEKLQERQRNAQNYWLGKHDMDFITQVEELNQNHPLVDNLIFESLETFLPQATRKNAEPIVMAPDSSEGVQDGKELAERIRKTLIYLSDVLNFRLKTKTVVRNWALYFVGVGKMAWNFENDEIDFIPVRPQKLILDPNATITENGVYTGEYIGEFREDKASILVERFPKEEKFIKELVKDKMGTEVQYIEWWADDGRILFWTLKDKVLNSVLNPHWNYPEERTVVDDFGQERTESFTQGNHFNTPQFPYTFLSVFNLGIHPHDDTSLIEQNLGNQDLITKRYRQIDRNVDGMNGGWIISGDRSGITQEQSNQAIEALRSGWGVWQPEGSAQEGIQHISGNSLPGDVFNQLQDGRNELRGIFGVTGSTPQGIQSEQTVRGKIIVAQQDQSRIGGGVSEYIEQFWDRVYNMCVQFMYVYYDTEHLASVIGDENAFEMVSLKNSDLDRKVVVSVKEGSMIPRDPLTQRNEAIDLWSAGAIDPVTLHERLDDPDPRGTAERLLKFQTNPGSLVEQQAFDQLQQPQNDLLNSVPIQ